jgi:hydroxyethylthiazole kinase-like uncharacterized protein yjeF
MTALYSLSEIRAVELAAQAGLPPGTLMQRAGTAAAELALRLLPPGAPGRVLVLAGPGNNGGDALDMAARLATAHEVGILLFADPGKLPVDAAQALQRAQQSDAEFFPPEQAGALLVQPWSLVIDGLFGIGLSRAITGTLGETIRSLNNSSATVLALDIPSGLDADTGAIVGEGEADGIAVIADHTITFIGDKPGLHTCNGRDHAGAVVVAGLDIEASLFPPCRTQLSQPELFRHAILPRRHNTHKGSYGDVAVLGGASGMAGATLLAARAALKCGAGKTYAVFLDDAPALDLEQPELMCRRLEDFEIGSGVLVAGPGLGQSEAARAVLQKALSGKTALVLDADALNMLAAEPVMQRELARRHTLPILTPHPLEAARLLGATSKAVQADRLGAARGLAQALHAIVVLKGSGSIIATPDGQAAINPTGNPGLATAGSGDVLAGICGALLAQGLPSWEAALAAVWLHGSAGDLLVERGVGPIGLSAGELIGPVRTLINRLAYQPA